eukprot:scaffold107411_cov60-Phaeocystis_antarctica.AAC.3
MNHNNIILDFCRDRATSWTGGARSRSSRPGVASPPAPRASARQPPAARRRCGRAARCPRPFRTQQRPSGWSARRSATPAGTARCRSRPARP